MRLANWAIDDSAHVNRHSDPFYKENNNPFEISHKFVDAIYKNATIYYDISLEMKYVKFLLENVDSSLVFNV